MAKEEYEFDDKHWGHLSGGAKDLVSKLLKADPNVRFTPAQVRSQSCPLAVPWNTCQSLLPNLEHLSIIARGGSLPQMDVLTVVRG